MTEKELLKDQIYRIKNLTSSNIEEYKRSVSLNNWSDSITKEIYRAIEEKEEELNLEAGNDFLVVGDEISEID